MIRVPPFQKQDWNEGLNCDILLCVIIFGKNIIQGKIALKKP
jgi:hypothetical protein